MKMFSPLPLYSIPGGQNVKMSTNRQHSEHKARLIVLTVFMTVIESMCMSEVLF